MQNECIVVCVFCNAAALMLIPLLTLYGLVARWFFFLFVLWLSRICLPFYPQMFDWGLFYDSVLNGCDKVCVCVFELCWATDITAGTQLKSLRLQIKQNVTINVAKEQGELWWVSLWGFTWLSGGAGTWDNRNAELSLPCSALVWLWLLLRVCVCVCLLGNPVEMKGAATHWPGDYSITFVSVPGLKLETLFSFPKTSVILGMWITGI